MTDWFRSWHGAPTDNKWLVIGRKAGVAPGVVAAIMWALLDHASQAESRGSVADFDVETYAAFSGFEEDQVEAVLAALLAKKVIENGRLAAWEKRQPKREDDSRDRVAALRDKRKEARVTQGNAYSDDVTDGNAPEERRGEKKREEKKETQAAAAPAKEAWTFEELGAWLRSQVGTEPIVQDFDVRPVQRLLDEGLTQDDVRNGIAAAMAKPNFRLRSWGQLEGWIRGAAKDRLGKSPKKIGKGADPPAAAPLDAETTRRGHLTKALAHFRDEWLSQWKGRPGTPECTIPPDVIEEARGIVEAELRSRPGRASQAA